MLTEQQRRFAYQLSQGATLAEAADFVDIAPDTANTWFNNPEVSAVLLADKQASALIALTTKERVLAQIISMSQADIGDYYVPGTGWQELKAVEDLTEAQRKRIQAVEWTQHGPKLKLYDSVKLLNDVAKYIGMADGDSEDMNATEFADAMREFARKARAATRGD